MWGHEVWDSRLIPPPDAYREKLVFQAVLVWQDGKARW
jgi:hypothetical protein